VTPKNSEPPVKKPKRALYGSLRTLQAASMHPFRKINCSCKKKCNAKISTEQRHKNHEKFWQYDANARRNFIYYRVSRWNKEESTVGHVSRRDVTFGYTLIHPESNEVISICKLFFSHHAWFLSKE